MKWDAVYFDFDGVIADSVQVKTEAFALMFRPFGAEIEKKVVDYHLANGGLSRFAKFKYWYENYLEIAISEPKLNELSDQFSGIVKQKVIEAPFIAGALQTLDDLKSIQTKCYIVSATPEPEMKQIIESKNLGNYFIDIFGSPSKKEDAIKNVLIRDKLDAGKCLFIGDAMQDYLASQMTEVNFLGIVKRGMKSPFPVNTLLSHYVYADYEQYWSNKMNLTNAKFEIA